MPKGMRHFGWSKTEAIIQVHGIGPFQIIPADTEEHLSGWRNTPQNGWLRDPMTASFFKFKITERVKSKRGEGMIVGGMHSEKSQITQYFVQMDNGDAFCESEKDLTIVPKEKLAGPLNGKWEVRTHGAPWCEDCNLYFQQTNSGLTGVYSLSWYGVAFKSSTFKDNVLEIRLETLIGNFALRGKYNEGTLSGDWSTDTGVSGKWEATKTKETLSGNRGTAFRPQ